MLMSKPLLSFLFFLFAAIPVYAADFQVQEIRNDSVLKIMGKVLNRQTQAPVGTRVTFERLPHGSNFIISSSDNSHGGYESSLIKNNSYRIEVKAEGFAPYTEVVEVKDAGGQAVVIRDILLVPSIIGQTLKMDNLIFKQGQSDILVSSYAELDMVADMLKETPSMIIQLEGHTDFRGNPKLNVELSEDRVEAVKDYLVKKGIKKKRIKLKAFGGSMPLSNENTVEAQRMNRRVEVRILKK